MKHNYCSKFYVLFRLLFTSVGNKFVHFLEGDTEYEFQVLSGVASSAIDHNWLNGDKTLQWQQRIKQLWAELGTEVFWAKC